MDINVAALDINEEIKQSFNKLLDKAKNFRGSDLEKMWHMLDYVWDDLGCHNKKIDKDKLQQYYSHEVWLLNGFFIEQHKESMEYRELFANWIIKNKCQKVVDYGGGFGTLARCIAKKDKTLNIHIYEPYASEFNIKTNAEYNNIRIVNELGHDYDCLISTDVLEHVEDPLKTLASMIKAVKPGGYLILANCFYPVIKCHLPMTFHLRFFFNLYARLMGLIKTQKLAYASVFQKNKEVKINWQVIRLLEKITKFMYPVIYILIYPADFLKNMLRRIVNKIQIYYK